MVVIRQVLLLSCDGHSLTLHLAESIACDLGDVSLLCLYGRGVF